MGKDPKVDSTVCPYSIDTSFESTPTDSKSLQVSSFVPFSSCKIADHAILGSRL